MTEDEQRVEHMHQSLRDADYYIIRGEWSRALAMVETAQLLICAAQLAEERDQMRAEMARESDMQRWNTDK